MEPSLKTEPAVSVLIAEDNPEVREFVARALSSCGFKTTEAADGQEALEALTREKFNILVTDIVMPHVDGIALAMKATRMAPDLKIIMISGYAQERIRAHNLDTLVYKILVKPFSLEEICETVKNAVSLPTNAL